MLASPVASHLPTRTVLDMLQDLQKSYETAEYGVFFVRQWLGANPLAEMKTVVLHNLSLCLIAAGYFEDAKREIERDKNLEIKSGKFFQLCDGRMGHPDWSLGNCSKKQLRRSKS